MSPAKRNEREKRASSRHARALAKHTPERAVTVKVDASLKKRWTALLAIVRAAKSSEAHDFDRLWEAVGEIIHKDLHVLGGYTSAADFFHRELGENERNAYRYIKVAKLASPVEEDRYGVSKLDAALAFLAVKLGAPLEHPPLPVAFERLRIPVAGGKTKSLEEATVQDVAAATRALAKTGKAPVSEAERALQAKHPAFKSVRLRVRNGLVDVVGIPVASIGVFGTVVRDAKWKA